MSSNVKKKSRTKDGDKLISPFCPNFKIKEFACNDGSDRILIDKNMIYILQYFREFINKPVQINSAYRTPTYNKKIGGASQSYHIYGRAFDINGVVPLNTITSFFNTLGVKGIIKYSESNFVHIDSRDTRYHADSHGNYITYKKVTLPFKRKLNRSSKGVDVAIVQFKLLQMGFFKGKVSGYYDLETKQAVKKFQSNYGLVIDGHIKKADWKKLFS